MSVAIYLVAQVSLSQVQLSGMNPGGSPRNLDQLLSWLAWLLSDIGCLESGKTFMSELEKKVQSPIELRSCFCGIDMSRMGATQVMGFFDMDHNLKCTESCEINLSCQRILRSWPASSEHVLFEDRHQP